METFSTCAEELGRAEAGLAHHPPLQPALHTFITLFITTQQTVHQHLKHTHTLSLHPKHLLYSIWRVLNIK